MRKINKPDKLDSMKSVHDKPTNPHESVEELGFMLWKAELNKELMSFWKALIKDDEQDN